MSKVAWAHLGLLFVNLIYGGNYIVAKDLMPNVVGPSGFITLRILGATLLFGILYARNFERIAKKDWIRIIACGVFGAACNQLLFFNGLSLTSPINSSIIMTTTPILVLILSSLILKERITFRKGLGIALGFGGAIALILSGTNSPTMLSSGVGDLMIFLNALSYGIYLILVKPLMQKYRGTTLIFWVFIVGFILSLPFGYHQFVAIEWSVMSNAHLVGIIYVVVGTTFLAYLLNIFSLKYVSPSVTSSYIYLQPIVAWLAAILLFSWGFTQQNLNDFTITKLLLMLLIFTGVYLVSKPQKIKA